ncbi:hypothetical protein CVIRNUC_008770 [Coccomyxa viridis]|uniref:Preprotein translocase subunit SecE n=1 Tax=Coccomyxa viridis TaxID=1274662 RepID=A0AAV1IGH2_9CHLO|nr:hypothetical protein CVIRNUC_008770 [Coccomyxa viridis]
MQKGPLYRPNSTLRQGKISTHRGSVRSRRWQRGFAWIIIAALAIIIIIRARELTYPKPKEMLRLTLIVLACSALLTALVWAIDAAFASVLLPPVLRKMAI